MSDNASIAIVIVAICLSLSGCLITTKITDTIQANASCEKAKATQ